MSHNFNKTKYNLFVALEFLLFVAIIYSISRENLLIIIVLFISMFIVSIYLFRMKIAYFRFIFHNLVYLIKKRSK